MKSYCTILIVAGLLGSACSDEDNFQFPASLNVVHAVNNASSLYVDHFNHGIIFSQNSDSLSFGSSQRITLVANTEQTISFILGTDTTRQLFDEIVNFPSGSINTLFLTGSVESIERTFVQDSPLVLTDSLMGIRFVNLSPDAGPIAIEIIDQEGNIVENLNFKSASPYSTLSATSDIDDYTVVFKNADDEVLTSYTFDLFAEPRSFFGAPRSRVFKNVSIVLTGEVADELSVSLIDGF